MITVFDVTGFMLIGLFLLIIYFRYFKNKDGEEEKKWQERKWKNVMNVKK